jgi:hypothetical protein
MRPFLPMTYRGELASDHYQQVRACQELQPFSCAHFGLSVGRNG